MPIYYRRLREKRALFSVLDEIPGISPKRKKARVEGIAALPLVARIVEQLHRVNDKGSP
jgi:excinuclease UvrABC nuclease subunit